VSSARFRTACATSSRASTEFCSVPSVPTTILSAPSSRMRRAFSALALRLEMRASGEPKHATSSCELATTERSREAKSSRVSSTVWPSSSQPSRGSGALHVPKPGGGVSIQRLFEVPVESALRVYCELLGFHTARLPPFPHGSPAPTVFGGPLYRRCGRLTICFWAYLCVTGRPRWAS